MEVFNLYQEVAVDLKERILNDGFSEGKLPNERVLSESYNVSRSTMKKAIESLVEDGLLIRKPRSGTYVNLLSKKNYEHYAHQKKGPIGLTQAFTDLGKKITSEILLFEVVQPPEEIRRGLLLLEGDFTYHFKRVRLIDNLPVSIETDYIPIQLFPNLTKDMLTSSVYDNALKEVGISLVSSFVSIFSKPSTLEDQEKLKLSPFEPVTVTEEIVFTEKGTPFVYSIVRNHYKMFTYNTSTNILKER